MALPNVLTDGGSVLPDIGNDPTGGASSTTGGSHVPFVDMFKDALQSAVSTRETQREKWRKTSRGKNRTTFTER